MANMVRSKCIENFRLESNRRGSKPEENYSHWCAAYLNWDFVIAMATLLGLNIKMNWMAKHTIFKFGFKTLLEWLGGIPTNRLQPDLIVKNVTN